PETPLVRLSELFNVNHFIVSQANPYIVPFMTRGLRDSKSGRSDKLGSTSITDRVAKVVLAEIKHRMGQLVEEKVSGNVTIVPEVQLQDFLKLVSNPTNESIQYWIIKGEQSTWPSLSMLKYRLMIELALDRILLQLREEASPSMATLGPDGTHQHIMTSIRNAHHRRQKSGPKRYAPNMHSPSVTRRGSSVNVGTMGRIAPMTSHAESEEQDRAERLYQQQQHQHHLKSQDYEGTMNGTEKGLGLLEPDAAPYLDSKRSKSMH
ncbi:hypothetical protein BGW38_009205, partial [Lunasporangiospora selenospora]